VTPQASVTGGCQCGAVRYEITGPLRNPHICHCRMCQKAFGNLFAAFVSAKKSEIRWTRARPGVFKSSSIVERGFCPSCGTPLFVADTDREDVAVSIGSLDHPERISLESQYGIESRHPEFGRLHELPGSCTEDSVPPGRLALYKSLQYPDD
jgi:hypothetical protein